MITPKRYLYSPWNEYYMAPLMGELIYTCRGYGGNISDPLNWAIISLRGLFRAFLNHPQKWAIHSLPGMCRALFLDHSPQKIAHDFVPGTIAGLFLDNFSTPKMDHQLIPGVFFGICPPNMGHRFVPWNNLSLFW